TQLRGLHNANQSAVKSADPAKVQQLLHIGHDDTLVMRWNWRLTIGGQIGNGSQDGHSDDTQACPHRDFCTTQKSQTSHSGVAEVRSGSRRHVYDTEITEPPQ
ncbi:hypothetical protein BaRGS_00013787, partial [Batillaria attramentaria]